MAEENCRIGLMTREDIDYIVATFGVWHKFQPQFEGYFAGERVVLLGWTDGKVVGYVTVLCGSRFSADPAMNRIAC